MSSLHQNATFPSDSARFNGEARYTPQSSMPTRHISAPRTDRSRPTLTSNRGDSPFPTHAQQGPTIAHRRPAAQPARHDFKGHDAALSHVQNKGLTVTIHTLNGTEPIRGIVVRRDRFTVTIERESKTSPGTVYHEIFYKHAIESIALPEFAKDEVR